MKEEIKKNNLSNKYRINFTASDVTKKLTAKIIKKKNNIYFGKKFIIFRN